MLELLERFKNTYTFLDMGEEGPKTVPFWGGQNNVGATELIVGLHLRNRRFGNLSSTRLGFGRRVHDVGNMLDKLESAYT